MVDVEVQKKAGFSLQPEEEQLRVQLESIQQELNAPNLFKVDLVFTGCNWLSSWSMSMIGLMDHYQSMAACSVLSIKKKTMTVNQRQTPKNR